MGIRGPAPEPLELRLLKGCRSHRRRVPTGAPHAPEGRPACPIAFGAVARRYWRRIVPQLEAMRILSPVDSAVIEALCLAYEAMHQANATLRELDRLGRAAQLAGDVAAAVAFADRRLDWLRALSASQSQIRALSRELGLTPSARGGIHASPEPSHDDPGEAWLEDGSGGSKAS